MTLIPHERIKSNIQRLVCKFFFLCDEATEEKKEASGCSDPVEVQVIQRENPAMSFCKFTGNLLE